MGHLIPAGTGLKHFKDIIVTTKDTVPAVEEEAVKEEAAKRVRTKEKAAASS